MAAKDHINRQVDDLLSANSPATLMGARGLLHFKSVPTPVVYLVVIAIVASWIPLAYAVRAKFTKSDQPRVHIFLDMDQQARYGPQEANLMFANEMAMRPPIPGTVARGELDADDFFYRGYTLENGEPSFFDGFPERVEITPELMTRGKELFARYCYLCHGYDGYGNGPIHVRATQNTTKNPKWVQPSNLHDDVRRERPTGHIYNTISVGIRNMAGYGHQIPAAEDRWAIVAYVRALQLSQDAPLEQIPADVREAMPVQPTLISGAALLQTAEAQEGIGEAGEPAGVPDAPEGESDEQNNE